MTTRLRSNTWTIAALLVSPIVCLWGCSSGREAGSAAPVRSGVNATDASMQQGAPRSRPIALVANQPVLAGTILPQLAELSGGIAIEELALDIMLAKEIASQGLTIDQRAIDAERTKLVEAIAEEAKVSIDQAAEMLNDLRVRRGLGDVRFDQLLSRNAKLRALAQDQVNITQEMIAREEAFLNGPRVRIRIAVLPTQVAAATLRTNVLASAAGEGRIIRFATLSLEQSVDSTAAVGGLITSVSPQDPSLPSTLRNALSSLKAGDVSDVLALPSGFGVVLDEGDVAPAALIDRAKVEAKLRSRLERLAMDAISRQCIKEAQVQVLDPNFASSWEARASR